MPLAVANRFVQLRHFAKACLRACFYPVSQLPKHFHLLNMQHPQT